MITGVAHRAPVPDNYNLIKMFIPFKSLLPFKFKRTIKEHLGVPSFHWSLQNLKKKNFCPGVVIDIGAYEGLWSLDVLEVFPQAKILMIEAQESKAPFLKAIKNQHGNVSYAISLLSSQDGVMKSFADNETASFIVKHEAPNVVYKKIKTQSLDTLLAGMKFPFPDFLKLDVQGHELEILKGAEKSLAHSTVCLLEVSLLNLGNDDPLLSDVVSFMDNKGFQAYDISQLIRRPFDNALFQADIFFVKKDSLLIADKNW